MRMAKIQDKKAMEVRVGLRESVFQDVLVLACAEIRGGFARLGV